MTPGAIAVVFLIDLIWKQGDPTWGTAYHSSSPSSQHSGGSRSAHTRRYDLPVAHFSANQGLRPVSIIQSKSLHVFKTVPDDDRVDDESWIAEPSIQSLSGAVLL